MSTSSKFKIDLLDEGEPKDGDDAGQHRGQKPRGHDADQLFVLYSVQLMLDEAEA